MGHMNTVLVINLIKLIWCKVKKHAQLVEINQSANILSCTLGLTLLCRGRPLLQPWLGDH